MIFLARLPLSSFMKRCLSFIGWDRGCLAANKSAFYAVFMTITWVSLAFSLVPKAHALSPSTLRPSYLMQLESYSRDVKDYLEEKEREKREEELNNSLIKHIVKPGETLYDIAAAYNVDPVSLAFWNGINNPHRINSGEVLDILLVEGVLHTVKKGETLEFIAGRYGVKEGVVAKYNLLHGDVSLFAGEKIVVPGGKLPEDVTAEVQANFFPSRSGGTWNRIPWERQEIPSFYWPLKGKITSLFGRRGSSFHYGLDIAAPYGKKIGAAAAGLVDFSGYQKGYGFMLVIDHGGGWSTLYAHTSRLLVEKGGYVVQGQPVATVGSSGNATGPHLHLEIIYQGQKLDPLSFLKD